MDKLLKTQASSVASIDRDLLSELSHKAVADIVMPSVEIVRDIKASLNIICVSKHPTSIIQSPCKNLFVYSIETDDEDMVISFDLTSNPVKAMKFDFDWAERNAPAFKNGQGSFAKVSEREASEYVLISSINSVKGMVNNLIASDKSKVESWEQIQGNYMGDFYKHDNSSLTD